MKLIIGLGNPGAEYENTRHNIGFMVVEKLAKEISTTTLLWEENKKLSSYIARVGDVLLSKPTTFMNKSGESVKKIVDYYKLSPQDVWVIHDDMDLPLGKIRLRQSGASAGHNGVENIIKHLNTDKFLRFRLGIGRTKDGEDIGKDKEHRHRRVIQFVLSKFSFGEAGAMRTLIKHAVDAVRVSLNDGVDKAMNRYN